MQESLEGTVVRLQFSQTLEASVVGTPLRIDQFARKKQRVLLILEVFWELSIPPTHQFWLTFMMSSSILTNFTPKGFGILPEKLAFPAIPSYVNFGL